MARAIQFYETETGNRPVEKFIRSLSQLEKAKALAVFEYIEENETVPATLFCKMVSTKDLWEVRVKAGGNIFRFLSFFDGGRLIVVAHGFQKKTQKTPKQEIETAEKRKRDYFSRKQN